MPRKNTREAMADDSATMVLFNLSFASLLSDVSLSDKNSGGASYSISDLEMKPRDYRRLKELPGNNRCIDCDCGETEWASVSFGILMCANCSGAHRSLGTHISRVKSVRMDCWSHKHLAMMKQGGNQKCKEFLELAGVDFANAYVRERYSSDAASKYHEALTELAKDNTPESESDDALEEKDKGDADDDRAENDDEKPIDLLVPFGTRNMQEETLQMDHVGEYNLNATGNVSNHDNAEASRLKSAVRAFTTYVARPRSKQRRNTVCSSDRKNRPSLVAAEERDTSTAESAMPVKSASGGNRRQSCSLLPPRSASGTLFHRRRSLANNNAINKGLQQRQALPKRRATLDTAAAVRLRQYVGPTTIDNQHGKHFRHRASSATPTVTYMGRIFADDYLCTESTIHADTMEAGDSRFSRLPWKQASFSSRFNNDANSDDGDQVASHLRSLSDIEFSDLKAALRHSGALTTMSLKFEIHSVAASASPCSVVSRSRASSCDGKEHPPFNERRKRVNSCDSIIHEHSLGEESKPIFCRKTSFSAPSVDYSESQSSKIMIISSLA